MYGIFPTDTNGICSGYESDGLSFIGYYENGIPTGPCWRRLVGGSWMYGIVDENGQFTGKKDIAYIYPDLELLMVGQYKNGLLVNQSFTLLLTLIRNLPQKVLFNNITGRRTRS